MNISKTSCCRNERRSGSPRSKTPAARNRPKRGHPTARVVSTLVQTLSLLRTCVACNMTLKRFTRRGWPGSGGVPHGHALARAVGPKVQQDRFRGCSGRGRVLSYQDLRAKRVQRILGHTCHHDGPSRCLRPFARESNFTARPWRPLSRASLR